MNLRTPVAVAISLLAVPAIVHAELSSTVTVVSDYLFDGVTQTDHDPALQASLDYAHDSGFWTGVWASNVDYGIDTDVELDVYAGWSKGVSDNVSIDLAAYRYTYDGDDCDCDYNEYLVGVALNATTMQLWYADDYANSGASSWRAKVKHDFSLGETWSLGLELTHSDIEDAGDYEHWRIGLGRSMWGFDFDLSYHDNNEDGEIFGDPDLSDSRVVLSIGRTFGFGGGAAETTGVRTRSSPPRVINIEERR